MSEEKIKEKTQEILANIDQMKIAELTSSLIKFPSINPPGREKDIAEFIASWFEKRGFDVQLFESAKDRPNIIVRLSGLEKGSSTAKRVEGRTLILNGHMDVVPEGTGWTFDPFGGSIENGRVYGRGSADMKGGLASMMIALEEIKRSNILDFINGSIVFSAVVDEEMGGSFGTSYLVREKGLKGDFAIIGEPTSLEVCTSHKGNITFEISTYGKSAHASMPQLGINAIFKMNEIISALLDYSKELDKRPGHPLLGKPTLNIGTINGGIKSNIVPDRCTISAERRVLPSETLEEVKVEIENLLVGVKDKDKSLEYTVNFKTLTGPSEFYDNEEALRCIITSLEGIRGVFNMKTTGFPATCDAYFLTTFGKTPTVIFGPGDLSNAHSPDEYVEIEDLGKAAKVYAQTAILFLSKFTNVST